MACGGWLVVVFGDYYLLVVLLRRSVSVGCRRCLWLGVGLCLLMWCVYCLHLLWVSC